MATMLPLMLLGDRTSSLQQRAALHVEQQQQQQQQQQQPEFLASCQAFDAHENITLYDELASDDFYSCTDGQELNDSDDAGS